MSDIALNIINGCFDFEFSENDLVSDAGLQTAVAISLFTDQRITDEELPDLQESKKGWWGDAISEVDQDQIGSKVWLLDRGKRTQVDLNKLKGYALNALEWMKEDGVTDRIEVTARFLTNGETSLEVLIGRPEQGATRFNVIWDAQDIRRI